MSNLLISSQRPFDIRRFYTYLEQLEIVVGEKRLLDKCTGRMNWPKRGVYYFYEPEEIRTTSGVGMRVVRVGTHALIEGGQQNLWHRLATHRGNLINGGGNHRGSAFRRHVGAALLRRDDSWPEQIHETWGIGKNAPREVRDIEHPLEVAVSNHIRHMPFLWLEVDDPPGPESVRGFIESNSIALLSNLNIQSKPFDLPSENWLGLFSPTEEIRHSGLWNVNHVRESYDARFLNTIQQLVRKMEKK